MSILIVVLNFVTYKQTKSFRLQVVNRFLIYLQLEDAL